MLRGIFEGLIDLVYPKICLACKNKLKSFASVDNLVCQECWGKIKRTLPPFCHCCGRHLEKRSLTKSLCDRCLKRQFNFDRAFSACAYESVTRELIHAFKYQSKEHLGLTLSRLMIEFIQEYNLPIKDMDLIIPMPLHKTRLREREFNQAEILANHIAEKFNKKVLNNNLIRHRHTRTQTDLEEDERILNVKNSFSLTDKKATEGKKILLIDDVFTTGATASWAAHSLKESGANIVFVLTLAN